MKSFIYILILSLFWGRSWAQTPHLITIAELKQLASCPDYTCLGSMVNVWNFTYKTKKEGKKGGLMGTQYMYIRSHRNRAFNESTVSYWAMNDGSKRVMLTSDNQNWSANLATAIEQAGFKPTDQKGVSAGIHYVLEESGVIWHLYWKRPSLFVDLEPHSLTVYAIQTKNEQPASPVLAQPIVSESPKLGGDWDTNYPPQNAATLLKAERQYAANYEREHGKTGHTFDRVEKVRIEGKRLGQYRALTDKRWGDSFDLALRMTGFDKFANEKSRLYKQEALFDIAGERIWAPIQEPLIHSLEKEVAVGKPMTLYAVLVSHHDFGGNLHLSFLINEFAANRTPDTNGSAVSNVALASEATNSDNRDKPLAQKERSGCGFKWVAWSAVPMIDKAAMKAVMVPDHDGGYTGSLFQYVTDELKQGSKIQIARHDFYEKKQPGYVVYIAYSKLRNGDSGRVEVYEDNGESYLFPYASVKKDVCSIRPADDNKGIIFEDGRQEAFTSWMFFAQTYAGFLKATGQPTVVKKSASATEQNGNRLGGKTPEDLCLLLLKALKTNNKTLWMQCMSPDTEVEDDELSAKRFQWYRECLDEQGITDWASVTFSRMTHLVRPSGGGRVDLEKIRSRIGLEFTYKNGEFVGKVSFASFSKNDGLWQVRCGESGEYACSVNRSMR